MAWPGICWKLNGAAVDEVAPSERAAEWDRLLTRPDNDRLTVAVLAIQDGVLGPRRLIEPLCARVPARPGFNPVDDLAGLVVDIRRDDELDRMARFAGWGQRLVGLDDTFVSSTLSRMARRSALN